MYTADQSDLHTSYIATLTFYFVLFWCQGRQATMCRIFMDALHKCAAAAPHYGRRTVAQNTHFLDVTG